jgi:hypothetical protein
MSYGDVYIEFVINQTFCMKMGFIHFVSSGLRSVVQEGCSSWLFFVECRGSADVVGL